MKLYVSSRYDLIDEEIAKIILKKVGINKIDRFSPCYNKCFCDEFNDGLHIRFASYHEQETFRRKIFLFLINPITNLFRKNKRLVFTRKPLAYYNDNDNDKNIVFLLDLIFKHNAYLIPLIKHELVHIYNPEKHCENDLCLASKNYKNEIGFCDKCQKQFDEIINSINN